jgi:uncharacterized membrane protein
MSPFDWRSVVFARHAQHVVLIHFPIALFIVGVLFDLASIRLRRSELALAAYCNFWGAALFTLPALATGALAWHWALEGQRLKGALLLHLSFAVVSSLLIWTVCLLARRERRERVSRASRICRLIAELAGAALLALTGHLGGFLSGVNGGP